MMNIIHLRLFVFKQIFNHVNHVFMMVDGHHIFVKTVFHLRNLVFFFFG